MFHCHGLGTNSPKAIIRNCFGKCGVVISVVTTSQEPEYTEDYGKLDIECFAEDFITVDDNLDLWALHSRQYSERSHDIAARNFQQRRQCRCDHSICEDEPSAGETMHALDILRRAVAS